jgi:hypothetical protein
MVLRLGIEASHPAGRQISSLVVHTSSPLLVDQSRAEHTIV